VISELVTLAVAAAVAGVVLMLVRRWENPDKAPHRITPAARRILFPFVGETVSQSALDASLRLARAEHATLVPAYIATVPLQRNLDAPIPDDCAAAMPLLELIERRAARLDVPVDSRIETGRTARHALRRLAGNETFDRIVIPASDSRDGFSAEDIAWLLEHVDGEIVVLRAAAPEHLKTARRAQPRRRPGTPQPPSVSANGARRHGRP
jgi:nucleotide-binding universal stress UspA family protein